MNKTKLFLLLLPKMQDDAKDVLIQRWYVSPLSSMGELKSFLAFVRSVLVFLAPLQVSLTNGTNLKEASAYQLGMSGLLLNLLESSLSRW